MSVRRRCVVHGISLKSNHRPCDKQPLVKKSTAYTRSGIALYRLEDDTMSVSYAGPALPTERKTCMVLYSSNNLIAIKLTAPPVQGK